MENPGKKNKQSWDRLSEEEKFVVRYNGTQFALCGLSSANCNILFSRAAAAKRRR